MTLLQVYQKGKVLLEKAGIETPAFDAVCLFQKVFGLDRQQLIIHGTETAADSKAKSRTATAGGRRCWPSTKTRLGPCG